MIGYNFRTTIRNNLPFCNYPCSYLPLCNYPCSYLPFCNYPCSYLPFCNYPCGYLPFCNYPCGYLPFWLRFGNSNRCYISSSQLVPVVLGLVGRRGTMVDTFIQCSPCFSVLVIRSKVGSVCSSIPGCCASMLFFVCLCIICKLQCPLWWNWLRSILCYVAKST